jgi:pyruvate dehydrogenase E2 component (dihydrolipoamide acetyltransferase)
MLGLTMEEGTVAEWLKQEGDAVRKDEPLLTVEMDKGTMEVPAPASGVLSRILVQVGTTVAVRTPIAEIESSAPASGSSVKSPSTSTLLAAGGPADQPPRMPAPPPVAASSEAIAPSRSGSGASSPRQQGERMFASPRARMRARELGLDLALLRGTGPHGRIVEADVLTFSPSVGERVVATPLARRLAQEHGVDITAVQGTGPGGRITQDDVLRAASAAVAAAPVAAPVPAVAQAPEPVEAAEGVEALSRVRRITAERMAASAQATARVTLFLDADFTEASRFRAQLQPEFERLGVPKLPWDAIIAKAAANALQEHRHVQAQWSSDGRGLRRPHGVNVGVAVALDPEGLVVPVLRDAHSRSLRELAADLLALAERARAGRLTPAEMQGGTFTITNLGAYRIDGFTPIVNPPETAILGVGRVADKAVVVGGRVEARTMCTLSLSFDHRVVDGAPAAAFLARLAELLERPYALLGI